MRQLILVLGDQLDHYSSALQKLDPEQDTVWMAEVVEEATHVWCHKLRLAAFFSAMRHFRDELRERGTNVLYHELSENADEDHGSTFSEVLASTVEEHQPEKLVVLEPGDYRVLQSLREFADSVSIPLEVVADDHFYCGIEEFQEWAKGRKRIILEDFYRHMRRQHDVLMEGSGPVGGEWNFDSDNRQNFGKSGPGKIKAPRSFQTDEITDGVIKMVEARFGDHPGSTDEFDLPVTHEQARALLRDFIKYRLPEFGTWQDAMWTERPFLHHSRISFALNIHLLTARDCVEAAVEAYESGEAPINSVEGFIRQILGWREFVRGIYWQQMPEYIELNALECDRDVPQAYWDGETEMACVRDCMQSVIKHGYAHHIQRLMVLGLFSQLLGVHPRKFHDWHMAMYLDAIDWVSLPNTLGMSQWGDGGIVGTKPYCASGNYIHRMSNYCSGCRFNYKESTGEDACPVTTMYWHFLDRHRDRFENNQRIKFQLKNLERKSSEELQAIRERAEFVFEQFG